MLRLAQRDVDAALESGTARTEGVGRNLVVNRIKLRLDRQALKDVNRHLDAIDKILCRHKQGTRGRRYAVTTVMTPLAERTER